MIFRVLTTAEEATFRKWARNNYKPGAGDISCGWHPVVQDECVRMNREHADFVEERDAS